MALRLIRGVRMFGTKHNNEKIIKSISDYDIKKFDTYFFPSPDGDEGKNDYLNHVHHMRNVSERRFFTTPLKIIGSLVWMKYFVANTSYDTFPIVFLSVAGFILVYEEMSNTPPLICRNIALDHMEKKLKK